MSEKNVQEKKNGKWLLVIMWLLIIAAVGLGGYTGYKYYTEQQTAKEIKAMSSKWTSDDASKNNDEDGKASEELMNAIDEGKEDPLQLEIDWNSLRASNPDIAAWLYVPGTSMSYPILQEQTVGYFHYLNHDMYGNYEGIGSVFTPAMNEGVENNQLLLFAHNTFGYYGDVYFAKLAEWYANAETANQYRYAYVFYPDGTIEQYNVWAAANTTTEAPVYLLPQNKGSEEYQETLDFTAETSHYVIGTKPNANKKTLVLSTCEELSDYSQKRFYVSFARIATYKKTSS